MPVFAWRREPTRHFGDQFVPFASVGIQDSEKRWRAFSLLVDSGAVVSLLCRSVADLLGIAIESGRRITVTGIGRKPNEVFVHELIARIGDDPNPAFPTRFAISPSEDVPNLLGRLDVLDRFQVDLDVSLEETRFSAPWLTEPQRDLWRQLLAIENSIRDAWQAHSLPPQVDEAAWRFINRAGQLVRAAAGLIKLQRDYELPLILRSLFELSVQFEYLMRDREVRARLYLDYEHVTKYLTGQAWSSFPAGGADSSGDSSRINEGKAGNRARYECVLPQYCTKSGKPRGHWYPGNLRQLAEEVDRLPEYEAIYRLYSAWSHGDPWTANVLRAANGGFRHAFIYWARLLIQVVVAKKIILAGEAYQTLKRLARTLS